MASSAQLFEFTFHSSAASLEAPLGALHGDLERLAGRCDTGEAYTAGYVPIRRKWRTIYVPEPGLDWIQRQVGTLLFPADLALRSEVNGFVARRSIVTNALPHVGALHLQKFDIRDFFSNTSQERIVEALSRFGFGQEAAQLLGRIVSCKGALPFGARTSPRISNLVLAEFDEAMVALAGSESLTYTRYADDLSFSSAIEFDVESAVDSNLRKIGFELNAGKTKKFKQGQPMFVTGLAISDAERPRLRKRFKARLRQEFYFVEKFGINGHAESIEEHPGSASSRIMGQFHYAKSVEPKFTEKLQAKYPKAYRLLVPHRPDDRIARANRRRAGFLREVSLEPARPLPIYSPKVPMF